MVPRAGNPEPRYLSTPWGSINSMGLPNKGLPYYLDYISQQQALFPEKRYFQSITGFNISEDETLLKQITDSDFNGLVELNLSCPNVPGKPQTGYDFETVEQILTRVFEVYDGPLGLNYHLILILFILEMAAI